MRISSRPTHRKIRKSPTSRDRRDTKEDKIRKARARWLRANSSTFRQMLGDGDIMIPLGFPSPDFLAFDVQNGGKLVGHAYSIHPTREAAQAAAAARRAARKSEPPICQPAPGTRFGGGNDGTVWTVMLIVLTFAAALILWCMLLVD